MPAWVGAIAAIIGAGAGVYSSTQQPSTTDTSVPTITMAKAPEVETPVIDTDVATTAKNDYASIESAAKKKRQSYAMVATSPGGILTKAPTEQKQLSSVLG